MHRLIVIPLVIAAAWIGVRVGGCEQPAPGIAVGQTPTVASRSNAAGAPRYQGVGSCTAAACHGAPERAGEKWRSAYVLWITRDPHASAYSLLYNDDSRDIVKALDHLERREDARPYEDPRCLACHTTSPTSSRDLSHLAPDGVGCEACHGSAEKWLTVHTLKDWGHRSPGEKSRTWGMTNTRDLAVRAEVCARCHVGSPGRAVDHDLIAAGHPRLSFEFSAFLANLPRHWDERADRENNEGYDARAWAVGQVTSAREALRLLAARARGASHAPPPQTGTAVWPEFAEYDCFACHHDLAAPSFRQSLPARRPLGNYRWGNWYFAMAGLLGEQYGLPEVKRSLKRLEAVVSEPYPPPDDVVNLAADAGRQLDALTQTVRESRFDEETVDSLLSAISADVRARTSSWDQATQWYLAVVALTEARGDQVSRSGPSVGNADQQLRTALQDFRRELLFSPGAVGPDARYDSPRNFQPSDVELAAQRLVDLLQSREP